jgi:type I restriction enzyme, S subunit
MNADRLLEYSERISDAADAVPRLRRFVLELAVRGRLVEQQPTDAPVADLLADIARTKAGLDEIRGRNSSKNASPAVEPWCRVPASWHFVRLGDVTRVTMGSSPPGSSYNTAGRGVPLINGPVEFTHGPFGQTVVNQYTTEPTVFCEEGDFLICVRGSTTGRTNIAASKACIGRGVAAVHPLFDDQFIRLAIRVRQAAILEMGRGIAFPSISRDQLVGLPIPLPPLAEQHRIVAKVDELMALCDRLEAAQAEREVRRDRLVLASLARMIAPDGAAATAASGAARFHLEHFARLTTRPEHVKQLRQTILNLAVRGRLVPQDSRDAPIDLALCSLQDDGRSTTPTATEVKEQSADLPQGWRLSTLGEACDRIHYGYTASADKTKKDVRLLRITDIHNNAVNWATVPGCVISAEELPKYTLGPRDILVARTGGTIGKTFLVETVPVTAVFASYLIRLQPKLCMDARFTKLFMESPQYWDQLRDGARGAGQPNVNSKTLGAMSFHLPPLAEQRRIVAKVGELMALCDELEASLASAATDRGRLLEAFLHEALAPAA